MTKTTQLAEQIKRNLEIGEHKQTFAIITIITIVGFLISLYQLYKACNTPTAKILKRLRVLDAIGHQMLRRQIKKMLQESNAIEHVTPQIVRHFENTLLFTLSGASESELTEIIQECEAKVA